MIRDRRALGVLIGPPLGGHLCGESAEAPTDAIRAYVADEETARYLIDMGQSEIAEDDLPIYFDDEEEE